MFQPQPPLPGVLKQTPGSGILPCPQDPPHTPTAENFRELDKFKFGGEPLVPAGDHPERSNRSLLQGVAQGQKIQVVHLMLQTITKGTN